jgi:hypothetical protein
MIAAEERMPKTDPAEDLDRKGELDARLASPSSLLLAHRRAASAGKIPRNDSHLPEGIRGVSTHPQLAEIHFHIHSQPEAEINFIAKPTWNFHLLPGCGFRSQDHFESSD